MAFGPFERLVALRYLRARRKEGFVSLIAAFSLLGIALGVATLIIVMAVMNGFQEELLSRILGLNGHLGVYGANGVVTRYDEEAKRIAGLPGVVRVAPVVEGQAMAASLAGGAAGAIVRGMRPEDLKARKAVMEALTAGSFERFGQDGDDGIAIGERMAEKLGVKVGDEITLVSPKGQATAFGTIPRMRAYRIVALFNVGMYEYDNSFVYMPLPAAQLYFRMAETVSQIEVYLDDAKRISDARVAIHNASGGTLRVYDWEQANAAFFAAIEVERNVMFLILALIILVAAFNIISSLIMLVKDKGRDIAILRTMGATRGMIMRIFFIDGASVGAIGTLLGIGLGLAFVVNIETIRRWIEKMTGAELFDASIYFLDKLPARVEWGEVTLVGLLALGLSFAATLYPAWRAARLDPVEALRYE